MFWEETLQSCIISKKLEKDQKQREVESRGTNIQFTRTDGETIFACFAFFPGIPSCFFRLHVRWRTCSQSPGASLRWLLLVTSCLRAALFVLALSILCNMMISCGMIQLNSSNRLWSSSYSRHKVQPLYEISFCKLLVYSLRLFEPRHRGLYS